MQEVERSRYAEQGGRRADRHFKLPGPQGGAAAVEVDVMGQIRSRLEAPVIGPVVFSSKYGQ